MTVESESGKKRGGGGMGVRFNIFVGVGIFSLLFVFCIETVNHSKEVECNLLRLCASRVR